MSVIKIGMACHKPSVLPKNPLFMPIQVGSAIAAKRMENMCHDDEGDNISEKNASYCELTAQYWLWKNQEADYYGLCHYRRFLCFAQTKAEKNERNQIEAYAIDDYNLKRFGLENEAQMRSAIESNDVVVGELQKVSRLYTPRGNQNTAWKHWIAHDRALIHEEDLVKMLDILEEVSPAVGSAARKYLQTNTFLGFNCFVMKKELFNEMCSIEFEVLRRLEEVVDLTNYNQQLKRIYGFMGEIISSSYVHYLEQLGAYKVKHVPLVYFNYTDPLPKYTPWDVENVIPVLFMEEDEDAFKFAAVWRSFLDNIETEYNYDVIVSLYDATAPLKKIFTRMAAEYKNVKVRYVDAKHYGTIMAERTREVAKLMPFMPWILPEYKKMLVFGSNILFQQSVVELWNEKLDENQYLAAPYDVLMQARCNDIYKETEENYLSKQVKSVYHYFNAETMLLDFEKYRHLSVKKIFALRKNKMKQLRNSCEIINIVCEGKNKVVDQKWSVWMNESGYLKYQLPYAPNDVFMALLKAQKAPAILCYMSEDPWYPIGDTIDTVFWEVAERTPLYSRYLAYMNAEAASRRDKKDVLNKWFPKEKKMRGRLSRMFPKGSKRYNTAKRILGTFGMK